MSELTENPALPAGSLGPGARLRREREKRGLSALEAAERLHLDPWAVEALETNRFDSLGPPVYAKGHLRQYALLLSLPPAEILASYEGIQQDAAPAVEPAPAVPRESVPLSAPLSRLAVPIGGGVAAAAVFVSILMAWKPWSPSPAQQAATAPITGAAGASLSPGPLPAAEDSDAAPESSPGRAPQARTATGSAQMAAAGAAASAAIAQGGGRARLRMSFSADSWVEVREAGGATLFRGKGPANSVKVIAGVAPLTVFLGYVSGVQLEINNRVVAIGPQFVHGDVARFDAGADGVLRRSPRS
jgi:cytoskeleton protein RodZ